jgi:hypothetical protein
MKNPASYNPNSLEVCVGSTCYEEFHEWAHVSQHATPTLIWKIYLRCIPIPVICRLALLLVEIEAFLIARHTMQNLNIWNESDKKEAIAGLLSYVKSIKA